MVMTKAQVQRFNPESGDIETLEELSVWDCHKSDYATFEGICISTSDEDGSSDIVISSEALAEMGYVRA